MRSLSIGRVVGVLVLAGLLVAPLTNAVPLFWVTLADTIGMAAIVALGLVLLTGVGGMTSFGQAAFVGFGGYTAAVLSLTYGLSGWLTLPVALLVTGAIAALLGLVTVRLSGHYLPLGTLAWGLAFFYLFGNLDILGTHDGLSGIPPLKIGTFAFTDARSFWIIIWVGLILTFAATQNLLNSRIGRAIRALRQSSSAAEAFGVDTARVKLVVFVYAAVLAGLSGWMFAYFQRAVAPTSFGLSRSIDYLMMAVAGGSGHVYGALAGAILVTLAENWLQDLMPKLVGGIGGTEIIVFGIGLVLILQLARDGLWPHVAGLIDRFRAAPLPPPDADALPRRPLPPLGTTLLSVSHLTKRFGGLTAVNDISWDLSAGQIVGLIGPNGAGKSTTFNLVSGLARASAGSVTFCGERIETLSARRIARLGLARTFQHVKVVPDMSVLDNVALGATLRGHAGFLAAMLRLNRSEESRLMAEARRQIERVGLTDVMHRPAGTLALGQLRVLEIARALALDPVLLLLDEPAAGLRHREKQALARLLDRLRREGVGVLLVEHDMDFVMTLTDHIVVLNFGTRIAEGTPSEVRADAAVIAAYLGTTA
jgi:branched-chain amino acid transport system permease protein